ncbi:hypothetical protein BP5796_10810 [Coleophoma crateriformis]|uniref:Myb-like domain-containing protein n=1 Tax=Coleophoma crateriformis TaxID=565419 RepID=A0A3D8QLB9_9HELO|nr:hypothetical protein BP5796_10810 [Coleophoma crateriformis]
MRKQPHAHVVVFELERIGDVAGPYELDPCNAFEIPLFALSNRVIFNDKDYYPILDYLKGKNGIEVMTCTGSKNVSHGAIRASSILLKLESNQTYEVVWTVKLEETLKYGDFKSWILEKSTGRICGHIIAGHPRTGIAYVFPAERTFEDIKRQLECNISLLIEHKDMTGKVAEGITGRMKVAESIEPNDWIGAGESVLSATSKSFPPILSSPPGLVLPPAKKGRSSNPWTPAEEQRLKAMRDAGNGWADIANDMHYAEFAEDESQALINAIKEYETNKWKVIGAKVGKPAKVVFRNDATVQANIHTGMRTVRQGAFQIRILLTVLTPAKMAGPLPISYQDLL